MSRIFWDTMLFVYVLEDHPSFSPRAHDLLARSRRRCDRLYTSYLAIGEVLAGVEKSAHPEAARAVWDSVEAMDFTLLPFDGGAVSAFSKLRAREGLKAPDAIHLACAASAGIDLFLTGDRKLTQLDVPGIQFIADFNAPIL